MNGLQPHGVDERRMAQQPQVNLSQCVPAPCSTSGQTSAAAGAAPWDKQQC